MNKYYKYASEDPSEISERTRIIMLIILAIVSIGLISFEIWLWCTYGNTPWEEIPTWVKFFMINRRC